MLVYVYLHTFSVGQGHYLMLNPMWMALRRQNLYDDPYEPPEAARLRASALGDGEQLGTVFHKRKQLRLCKGNQPKPIGSMYAIYGNI